MTIEETLSCQTMDPRLKSALLGGIRRTETALEQWNDHEADELHAEYILTTLVGLALVEDGFAPVQLEPLVRTVVNVMTIDRTVTHDSPRKIFGKQRFDITIDQRRWLIEIKPYAQTFHDLEDDLEKLARALRPQAPDNEHGAADLPPQQDRRANSIS